MLPAEAEVWEQRVRELKLQPFVTAGSDLEDAFVNPENLAEKNGTLTQLEAATLISDSVEELKVDASRTT
jgi:hypothetical protein